MEHQFNCRDGLINELVRLTQVKQILRSGFRNSIVMGLLFVLITAWFFAQMLIDLWTDFKVTAVIHFIAVLSGLAIAMGAWYYAYRFRRNLNEVDERIEVIDQVVGTHG